MHVLVIFFIYEYKGNCPEKFQNNPYSDFFIIVTKDY